VRKLVRLVLFFSLGFVVLFLVSAGIRFLAIRIDWISTLSRQPRAVLTGLISAARWALSLSLYGGMLLGLSYMSRNKVFKPAGLFCLLILTFGIICGSNLLIKDWEKVPSSKTEITEIGQPGLMLSGTAGASGTVLVLLEGPAEPDKARVIAVPGKPMQYQAEFAGRDSSALPQARLPRVPFTDNTPWFMKSIAIDLRLSAENLANCFDRGFFPFLFYAGALIFLLSSLVFIFNFSMWPLANLCLGCLAFRGILALETFFNSPEIQDVFESFLQNRISVTLAVPLIFCGMGILIHLYTFFVYLAKRKSEYAN